MELFVRLKVWAKKLKRDGVTLWFAVKDAATPWYAKALGVIVVAYALSPIDLIPDFIPVLGYLDDVILLPGLIWLAIRLIPAEVLVACRERADHWISTSGAKPKSLFGAILILGLWAALSYWLWRWFMN